MVLQILLVLVLVGVGAFALLWSVSLIAQGYLYESVADGLVWRAAAGAGVVTAFLALWNVLHARQPESFDSLFTFSASESRTYQKFVSVRAPANGLPGVETTYSLYRLPSGQVEYRDAENRPWRRSGSGKVVAIKVKDDGEELTFVPDPASLDEQGNFRPGAVTFVDEGGGWTMVETDVGRAFRGRPGRVVSNLAINLAHLLVWFAVCWPLLRYTWGHALLTALAFWLTTTLLVLPFVLK